MTTFTLETAMPSIPLASNVTLARPYINFKNIIKPETTLESKLIEQPEFKIGLNWGVPRFGHPEGKVGFHIREVLDNIDLLEVSNESRQRLRITAIAHDTFKYQESATIAEGKRINHGLLARRFMEGEIDDETTLDMIELHDEIYFAWRHQALQDRPEKATKRMDVFLGRIKPHLKLHYLFFRCDTMTGDKIQAPRVWFDKQINSLGDEELVKYMSQHKYLD